MKPAHLILAALTTFFAAPPSVPAADPTPPPAAKFELLDGDRVVFLGNTLIEREQKYGYWELMLTMAWPDRNITFRNLGWSGDTVWGESRAGFGTQADGFKALVEQVNAAKPTVIFVGYGNVEAFDGEKGLPKFIEGFDKLLDVLEATKARIVLLGPVAQSTLHSKNTGAAEYNRSVELYDGAISELAKKRSHRFVGLAALSLAMHTPGADNPLAQSATTNGLDVTDTGYVMLGYFAIAESLGIAKSFYGLGSFLNEPIQADLLPAICKKNELFFHRWRPQNETYLFGFRKHEQGKNAKEVFEFDPLVAAEEKKIAELRTKLAAEMKGAKDAN